MSDVRPANILIVDDTPANLALLYNIVTSAGYEARTLPDGPSALRMAAHEPPDLVLLDIMMPDMDGFEVCRRLKAEAATREVPIIFLSALLETGYKTQGFAAGGVDYVTKPFQPEEVLARIATHLRLRALQQSLHRANDELRRLLERQQCIFNAAGEGIFGVDDERRMLFMNPMAERQLGYSLEEARTRDFHTLIHRPPTANPLVNAPHGQACPILRTIREGGSRFIDADHFTRKGGEVFPVEYTVSSPGAASPFAIVVFRDVTEQARVKHRLEEAARVFEVSGEGILITDPMGTILRVNPAFSEITGYATDEVVGQQPRVLKSGHHDEVFYREMWRRILRDGHWEGEIWNRRKDGSIFPQWEMISAIHDERGGVIGYVSQFSDIARRKLTEAEIRYRGNYDALTGLVNRSLLLERLQHALEEHRSKPRKLSLLCIDLDRFKPINDSLGHHLGDELLRQAARRIHQAARGKDTVARLGGDEFAVMMPELSEQTPCEHLACRLIQSLGEPFLLADREARMSAGIGVAFFPDDGDNAETLLRNADIALSRAKQRGRGQVEFFTPAMEREFVEYSQLECDLRLALERDELTLAFQPIIDLSHGHAAGVESLLRWKHPDRGWVSPAQFIPIAEEAGFITAIGAWVVETVCTQLGQWRAQGIACYASVNVSAHQIPHGMSPDWLAGLLRDAGLPPECLVLEITESVFIQDVEAVAEWLRDARRLGFRVYLDDFGTGYSSLSYLKRFPVDAVKIDQVFVREMTHQGSDQALVRAILAMSQGLGLQVVAEGVENAEQANLLRGLDCPFAQGYWYARPMPALELAPRLGTPFSLAQGIPA